MNIILVGFMGAGKTSVGRRLASRLGYRFIDVDLAIEFEQNCLIKEIFHYAGEKYFRSLETLFIQKLERQNNLVVSTGGGILVTEGNLQILRKVGTIVYLAADLDEIYNRVSKNTNRPLLLTDNPKQTLKDLFAKREHLYLQADIVIETTQLNIHQITSEIIRAI